MEVAGRNAVVTGAGSGIGRGIALVLARAGANVGIADIMLDNAKAVSDYFQDAAQALRGLPHVVDVRTIGLIAGIELASIPGKVGARAYDAFVRAFNDGILIRVTGDIIALSPPLVINKQQIDELFGKLAAILKTLA